MTDRDPRSILAYELLGEKGCAFLEQKFSCEDINEIFLKIQAREKPTPAATRYRESIPNIIQILQIKQLPEKVSISFAISTALTREVSQFTQDHEKLAYFWHKFFDDSHFVLGEYSQCLAGSKSNVSIYIRIKEHWPNSGTVHDVKIGKFLDNRWGYSDIECRVTNIVESFLELMR